MFLYHVVRKDHRHNFSLYFYHYYLNYFSTEPGGSLITKILFFLPYFLLILYIGLKFCHDLSLSLFLSTFSFVMFNRVCTAQYFLWYIVFIPLLPVKMKPLEIFICSGSWLLGQVAHRNTIL